MNPLLVVLAMVIELSCRGANHTCSGVDYGHEPCCSGVEYSSPKGLSNLANYRPRSEGDNVLRGVRPSPLQEGL